MTAFDVFDRAATGTRPEWIAAIVLLPVVGFAIARRWGPSAVRGAQLGLLVVAGETLVALILGVPVDGPALLLALLPLLGAATSRTRPSLGGAISSWILAFVVASPVILASHLGAGALAVAWLAAVLVASLARGIAEPLVIRLQDVAAAWRAAPWPRRNKR